MLQTTHVKDRKIREELSNSSGSILTKLPGTRYPAMKSDDVISAGLLHGTLNRNLICDPLRADKITLNESNAVFQSKVVNLLPVNNRNHDFVVANNTLPGSGTKC